MTDLFCDPKGKATNQSAPILLSRVDNTKPFTFTVKVKPQFTKNGTYSAGGIMLFENPEQWQKLCFEQDEAGKHRIVTVRTLEFSDDNNHEQIAGDYVYLRISSDTELIGNYYSEDGVNWQLVRVYKNNFLPVVYFCLSAQSPKDKVHRSSFSDVSMVDKPVKNFRTGEL